MWNRIDIAISHDRHLCSFPCFTGVLEMCFLSIYSNETTKISVKRSPYFKPLQSKDGVASTNIMESSTLNLPKAHSNDAKSMSGTIPDLGLTEIILLEGACGCIGISLPHLVLHICVWFDSDSKVSFLTLILNVVFYLLIL